MVLLKREKTQTVKGFTLIEVLVFVTIASLLLLAAVSISIVSINKLKSEQYKVWGNYFMDSLFEWIAGEKEKDWNNLVSKAGTASENIYCFNDLNISTWPSTTGECGNDYSLGANELFNGKSLFKREAGIVSLGNDTVKVRVTVYWKEKGGDRKIEGVRTFSFIER